MSNRRYTEKEWEKIDIKWKLDQNVFECGAWMRLINIVARSTWNTISSETFLSMYFQKTKTYFYPIVLRQICCYCCSIETKKFLILNIKKYLHRRKRTVPINIYTNLFGLLGKSNVEKIRFKKNWHVRYTATKHAPRTFFSRFARFFFFVVFLLTHFFTTQAPFNFWMKLVSRLIFFRWNFWIAATSLFLWIKLIKHSL